MARDVAYRLGTASDIEIVARLHAGSWQTAYRGILGDEFLDHRALTNRLALWRERLTSPHPGQLVELALIDAEPVGFVCALAADHPTWGSVIDNLHVSAAHRSSGVGRLLLEHAAVWLEERAPTEGVHLWVFEANGRARSFYERLGGRQVAIEVHDNPDGGRGPICLVAWPSPAELLARCRR